MHWVSFFKSIQVSTVAVGLLSFSTYPVFTTFLEPLFFKRGYSWATKSTHFEFNKPLYLGDVIIVRTWIEEIRQKSVKVCFQILKKGTEEIAAEGYFVYVLINAKTGKSENIPEDIVKKYSV